MIAMTGECGLQRITSCAPCKGRVVLCKHSLASLAQMSSSKIYLVSISRFNKQRVWETKSGTKARIPCSRNATRTAKGTDPSEQWCLENPEPGRCPV